MSEGEAQQANGIAVSIVQLPAAWASPEAQLRDVQRLVCEGPPTDLVLLPEACLTGYVSPGGSCDLRAFAEELGGPTTAVLASLAAEARAHLVGPLVLREGDRLYNATIVLDPDGNVVTTYKKRHPWYPETWASPGEEPLPIFEVSGTKVTLAVCFDLHFLEDENAAELGAADVLLFPSAWVEEEDSRPERLSSLARRFDIDIANANWGMGRPRLPGQGGSRLVSRTGRLLRKTERGDDVRPCRLDAHLGSRSPV